MNTQRVEGHTPTNLFKPLKVVRGPEGYQLHDAHGMVCDGMTGNHAQAVLTACNNIERLEKVNEALVRLAERCAGLNEHNHEIGAGMLMTIVTEARAALAKEPA